MDREAHPLNRIQMTDDDLDKAGAAMPPKTSARADTAVARYQVADLMRGARHVILEHDGASYTLRITAKGRLILTK